MPPLTRAASKLTSKKANKVFKNVKNNDEVKSKVFDKNKYKELKHALKINDINRVLKLSLEYTKAQSTYPNLTLRLLNFFIKANNYKLILKLLKLPNLDLKTSKGGKLLWQAVCKGYVDIARILVQAGANLAVKEIVNKSTILHAVLTSVKIKDQDTKEKLASVMLQYGANVNAVDEIGCSILQTAMKNELSTTFIKKLLQYGANVKIYYEHLEDDIYYVLKHKPELVLTFIQHQVPNEVIRNRRGVMAIEYLIRGHFAKKLEIIQQILNLGVPINSPDVKNSLGTAGCSLLHTALEEKELDVIKLLLKNGIDVHQKDEIGRTPLYQAARIFKGFSDACRLLISRGANINERNYNGRYPLHAACKNESLWNVHLLLSLGASLAVTDNKGYTPFDSMTIYLQSLTDAGRLVIKHFALMTAKNKPILERDLESIRECSDVYMFYQDCLKELENMKTHIACDNIPYFYLLSDNVHHNLLAVKNVNFVKTFRPNKSKIHDLFSIYYYNLHFSYYIALGKLRVFLAQKRLLDAVFIENFPDIVIEKIAFYSSLEQMIDEEKAVYLLIHEHTKHTEDGKRTLF